MSITATARPSRTPNPREKVCPRCGIEFADNRYRWKAGAPCADCRGYLCSFEGHDLNEWRTNPIPKKETRPA